MRKDDAMDVSEEDHAMGVPEEAEDDHAMGVPEEAEDDSVELARRKKREAERPSAMVLPRKRQVYVDIVSCGVGNLLFTLAPASGKNRLHRSLYTRCKALRAVACEHGDRRIDREEVASILRDAGIFSTTRFCFVSNARYFHNPEHNPVLRDHIGYHPEIVHMLATAKPQLLKAVISNVKDQVRRASMSGVEKPEVALLTFCKSGNHRAVAMAWMMQQALSHSRKVCSVQSFRHGRSGPMGHATVRPLRHLPGAGFAPWTRSTKKCSTRRGKLPERLGQKTACRFCREVCLAVAMVLPCHEVWQ